MCGYRDNLQFYQQFVILATKHKDLCLINSAPEQASQANIACIEISDQVFLSYIVAKANGLHVS